MAARSESSARYLRSDLGNAFAFRAEPPSKTDRLRRVQHNLRIGGFGLGDCDQNPGGKLPGAEKLERDFLDVMEDAGYTLLAIDTALALRAGRLPAEHRDPFDRMIAAQALGHDIPVLSSDAQLDQFGIRRIW